MASRATQPAFGYATDAVAMKTRDACNIAANVGVLAHISRAGDDVNEGIGDVSEGLEGERK